MARKKKEKVEEKFELPFAMIYAGKTYLPGQEDSIPDEVMKELLEKLMRMIADEEGE